MLRVFDNRVHLQTLQNSALFFPGDVYNSDKGLKFSFPFYSDITVKAESVGKKNFELVNSNQMVV